MATFHSAAYQRAVHDTFDPDPNDYDRQWCDDCMQFADLCDPEDHNDERMDTSETTSRVAAGVGDTETETTDA